MKKSVIFLMTILMVVSFDLKASPDQSFIQVKESYKHAQTYYWYGRYKENSLSEFQKSREYLDIALSELNAIDPADSIEAKRKATLLAEYTKFGETIDAMEEICIENLNGRYPLFYEISGRAKEYEYWDEAIEIALEDALDNTIHIPYPSKLIAEQMVFSIIISVPDDLFMEEVAIQYLSTNTSHLMVGKFSLLEFVTEEELQSLEESTGNSTILNKICKGLGTDKIGIYRITLEDEVENLIYWTATFSTYNNNGNFTALIKSDGFSADKNGLKMLALGGSFLFGLALVIIFLLIIATSLWLKKDKVRIGEGISISWEAGKFFILSLMIGTVIVSLLVLAVRPIIPGSDEFFKSIPSRLVWRSLVPFILSIAPLILCYIVTSKFYNKGLHQEENMFGVFAGSGLAYLLLLTFFQTIHLGALGGYKYFLFAFPLVLIYSYFLTYVYRKYFVNKLKENIIVLILFAPTMFLVAYHLLLDIKALQFGWSKVLIVISPLLAALVLKIILAQARKWRTQRGTVSDVKDRSNEINTVEELKLMFEKPREYVYVADSVGANLDFDSLAESFLISTEETNIQLIKGPRGIGKTRLIREFQDHMGSENGYIVFYGDCDEFQDADTIPYEPFVEALGAHIGVGAFSNQNKQVSQIVKTLQQVEIGPVSAIAGLLGANEDQTDGADANDVLIEIQKIFKRLQLNGNKVLLFLEDLQWIDDTSARLLIMLIKNICINKDDYKDFRLILTVRDDDIKDIKEMQFFRDLSSIDSNLLKISEIENKLLFGFDYSDYFNKLLENNKVHMNYYSELALTNYFNKNQFKIPLHFNQIMINIIDKGWILKDQDDFKLSSKARLEDILPPNDLSKIYREKFELLDPEMLKILISAAYIGMSFEAKILASVWWGIEEADKKILELFHNLQEAERLGLIIDKSEEDDVYEFTSRGLMAELRSYNNINPDQHYNSDPQEGVITLPQAVKEYHKRIITAIETYKGKDIDLDINLLCSVAKRCRYLDLHNAENRERLIKYNVLAGDRCARAGRLKEATDYYEFTYDIVSQKDISIKEREYDEVKRKLIVKLLQTYLDSSQEVKGASIFNDILFTDNELLAEYLILKALILYRSPGCIPGEVLSVMNEFKKIDKTQISELQNFRARFNVILANSRLKFEDENEKAANDEKVLKDLLALLKDLDILKDRNVSIEELKGEVLNNLANKYLYGGKPEQALPYLDRRTMIVLRMTDEELPLEDSRRKKILFEEMKIHQLSAHGRVSMKFNMGAYATYYRIIKDLENEIHYFRETKRINEELGDQMHVSLKSCDLAESLLNLKENVPYKEIYQLYYEAYWGGKFTALDDRFYWPVVQGISSANKQGELSKEIQVKKIRIDYIKMKLASANMSKEVLFHVLCHFNNVDETYQDALLTDLNKEEKNKYKLEDISKQIAMVGSKFFKEFADTPEVLWEKLKSGQNWNLCKLEKKSENKMEILFEFRKEEYMEGVGTDALIEVGDLDDDEIGNVQIEKKGKYDAQVIEREAQLSTWKVAVILSVKPDGGDVITIHPGSVAPPFPDKELQSEENYNISKVFWDSHAFISTKARYTSDS